MNDRQLAAMGMLGRGALETQVAEVFGINVRTLRRWKHLPGARAEIERVKANAERPDPEGVLYDALSARNDDGVNWNARLKSAIELRSRPGGGPLAKPTGVTQVNLTIYRGPPDPEPEPEPEDEDVIDVDPVEAEWRALRELDKR